MATLRAPLSDTESQSQTRGGYALKHHPGVPGVHIVRRHEGVGEVDHLADPLGERECDGVARAALCGSAQERANFKY